MRFNKIGIKIGFIQFVVVFSCYASVLHVDSGFDSLKPSLGLGAVETETSYTIANQIYDKLLDLDVDGNVIPSLAESWQFIDPQTLELKLKHGVEFHNGEPFNADCVKFSLEYFFGKNMFATQMLKPIASVVIVDPYTVRIKTNKADGLLLKRLAFWGFIYSFNYIKKFGADYAAMKPQGTGPYLFEMVTDGGVIMLSKNNNYWNENVQLFDKVFIHQKQTGVQPALDDSNGDLMHIIINPEANKALQMAKTGRYAIRKIPSFYEIFGIFNLRNEKSPVQDIRIRKAINCAVDRDALQKAVLRGNGRILSSLSMPGETGHDATLKRYVFNIQMAKNLVKEAGFSKGLKLIVGLQPDVSVDSSYFKFIKSSLSQANIELEIDAGFSLDDIVKPNVDGSVSPWHGDIVIGGDPSPYAHFDFIIYQFYVSGALFNMFRSKEFDMLYEDASTELNTIRQDMKYKILDKFIYDNVLAFISHQQIRAYAVHNDIDYAPPKNGVLNLRYVKETKHN